MTICKECYISMIPVMSSPKDKNKKFDRCSKCFCKTKYRKL